MKNLFSVFVFALIVLSTSCTKESLIIPQNEVFQNIETHDDFSVFKTRTISSGETIETEEPLAAAITLQIQVEEVTSSQTSGELLVDFTSNHDFSEDVLEDIQYLDFEDGNGNVSTLTFSVNSYTGGIGTLDVAFAIGSNNLSGLTLKTEQEIIINEEIIN